MTVTAPYSTDTPTLLKSNLTHVARAQVVMPDGETVDVDLEGGRLEWDDTRAPRVQAHLTCKVPTDAAQLARMDPRTGARLAVWAGYVRPDGVEDVQQVADLALRSRYVSRPADTLELSAASDESLIIDASPTDATVAALTGVGVVIRDVLRLVFPALTLTDTVGSLDTVPAGEQYGDRWDFVADLADRISAQVYDNGLRQWFLTPVPVLAAPAHVVAVGETGTIVDSDAGLDRDDGWANAVWLVHEWVDSGNVSHKVTALRRVTTGAYAATVGNTKILRVDRDSSITQAAANNAAASLVAKTVTRGRSFQVTAVSAYWLRPGNTLTVQLPLGDSEDHLVSGVSFDLRTGLMDVTTRLPDNTGTIGA